MFQHNTVYIEIYLRFINIKSSKIGKNGIVWNGFANILIIEKSNTNIAINENSFHNFYYRLKIYSIKYILHIHNTDIFNV